MAKASSEQSQHHELLTGTEKLHKNSPTDIKISKSAHQLKLTETDTWIKIGTT
jgi:hypothetical protein